jgi:hypothetical protein
MRWSRAMNEDSRWGYFLCAELGGWDNAGTRPRRQLDAPKP